MRITATINLTPDDLQVIAAHCGAIHDGRLPSAVECETYIHDAVASSLNQHYDEAMTMWRDRARRRA